MKKSIKRIIASSGLALAVAGIGAGVWFNLPYRTTTVDHDYVVELNTPALAAGWADDVFVASVTERDPSERDPHDLLWTPYDVTVKSTLQGEVNGDVRVVQEGGEDPLTRERVVVQGVADLEPGKTYILATRLNGRDGWHVIPANFKAIEVPEDGADALLASWKDGVAHPRSQEELIPSDVEKAADPEQLYEEAEAEPTGDATVESTPSN
ncbi:hypothetical protein [Actinoplanes siamensis]|uniref:Uncharacterized protein n=1 Tax=Actinoplanes siamensis TaxID=1223317 RepID=A0A919TNV0_9ACTN|nr:hypothetical protein [Actinoplanes siamensis]GIF09936.1 hypothetical protein Asi03nite_74740 [Actinoplanes siamensis]